MAQEHEKAGKVNKFILIKIESKPSRCDKSSQDLYDPRIFLLGTTTVPGPI
jgi:hypothetical protein